jgi:hypothetical protein
MLIENQIFMKMLFKPGGKRYYSMRENDSSWLHWVEGVTDMRI